MGDVGAFDDRVLNTWVKELCGVKKGVNGRFDECVLRGFDHTERSRTLRLLKMYTRGIHRKSSRGSTAKKVKRLSK